MRNYLGIPENFDYAEISLPTFPFFGGGGVDTRKRQKPQKMEQGLNPAFRIDTYEIFGVNVQRHFWL